MQIRIISRRKEMGKSFNDVSIKTKVHIPLIAGIVLGFIIIGVTAWISIRDMKKELFIEEKKNFKTFLETNLQFKEDIGITNALNIAKNGAVINALKTGNRAEAEKALQEINKDFKENTIFKNTKIHIHTADVKSFLRSWAPEKHGDDLSSFRHTINEVKKTKRPLSAIELGRAGFQLRGIAPILDSNGTYLGSVEFIQGLNSVVKQASQEDITLAFYVNKKYANVTTALKDAKTAKGHPLGVNEQNIDPLLLNEADLLDFSDPEFQSTPHFYAMVIPIKDFHGEDVGFAVIADTVEHIESMITDATKIIIFQIIVMAVIDIVLVVFILLAIQKAVIIPVKKLENIIKNIVSGEGDMTKTVTVDARDEVGMIGLYINQFIEHMRTLISDTKNASRDNVDAANQLSSTAHEIGVRSEERSHFVIQARERSDSAKDSVLEAVGLVEHTREGLLEANEGLNEARSKMDGLLKEVTETLESEHAVNEKLNHLNSEIGQIKGVLGIISDIADQTNLLALNAAIEAARAGEHGRGFAVVADEVRQLAERTQKSLTEINSTVNVIVQEITEATDSMNENTQKFDGLNKITSEVSAKISVASGVMTKSVEDSNKTSEKANIAESNILDLASDLAKIEDLASQDAANLEEISATASTLHEMVQSLNEKLNKFKTE